MMDNRLPTLTIQLCTDSDYPDDFQCLEVVQIGNGIFRINQTCFTTDEADMPPFGDVFQAEHIGADRYRLLSFLESSAINTSIKMAQAPRDT